MEIAFQSVLMALALASIVVGVYYSAVIYRIVRGQLAQPTLRDAMRISAPETGWPSLLVVVPAHNEQAVIESCVGSLLASDYPELRVVIALDRCTDDTRGVVERAIAHQAGDVRVDLCIIEDCPEDWAGKTHALHCGYRNVQSADGAGLVLFVDADTAFEPECLRAAAALLHDRNIDMLSVLPTLTSTTWFERIVQPAAGLELVRQFPLDKVNAINTQRHFANGQFMLWRRSAFDAIGGHERVKSELLEDIALARALHKPIPSTGARSSFRAGCFMADGLMRCQMYDSWPAFRRGWKRIYAEAARRYPAHLRRHARRVRVFGSVLPIAAVTAVVVGASTLDRWPSLAQGALVAGAVALALMSVALGCVYRAQRISVFWGPMYPCGALLLSKIMHESASDLEENRPTEWAGRSYQRSRATPRGGNK